MAVEVELLHHTIFKGLAPPTITEIAGAASARQFESGEIFYHQGECALGLYYLQAGEVKLYRQSHEKTQILTLLSVGESFGIDSLVTHVPCTTSAEALSKGWAIFWACEDIERLMQHHPEVSLVLLDLFSKQLRIFTSLVHNLAFRDVPTRLAGVLLQQGVHQNKTPLDNSLTIDRVLSQQDLASMVGTAREVIYRTLKKFEESGLIQLTSTQIVILDLERFQNFANQEIS